MGHIWYLHPLLWGYSTFLYIAQVVFLIKSKFTFDQRYPVLGLSCAQLALVVILDILICVYYSDTHLESRKHYFDPLKVDSAAMHLIYDDESTLGSVVSDRSRRSSIALDKN